MDLELSKSGPHSRHRGWILALAVTGLVAGCKTDPDEALVIFKVVVDEHVPSFATIHFAVDSRPGDKIHKKTDDRMFQFGYYMSGVSGKVTIRGRALDQHECVVGEGTLDVTGVVPGQRTLADGTLQITGPRHAGLPRFRNGR